MSKPTTIDNQKVRVDHGRAGSPPSLYIESLYGSGYAVMTEAELRKIVAYFEQWKKDNGQ